MEGFMEGAVEGFHASRDRQRAPSPKAIHRAESKQPASLYLIGRKSGPLAPGYGEYDEERVGTVRRDPGPVAFGRWVWWELVLRLSARLIILTSQL